MPRKTTKEGTRLKMISFRVDQETDEALTRLIAASGRDTVNRRSSVIRELILREDAREKQ